MVSSVTVSLITIRIDRDDASRGQSVYTPTGLRSTFAFGTNAGVDIDVHAHIHVYVYLSLRFLARARYAFPDPETHSATAYCRDTRRIKMAIVNLNVPRATKSYL